jgi:RNA polymerase sigma factor (sigma-70 family)
MDASSDSVGARTAVPEGSTARIADLYERHAIGALRLAFLLTADKSRAEDLVQDAFVRIITRFRRRDDPENFDAYLKRTVINLATSRRRRAVLENQWVHGQNAELASWVRPPDIEQQQLFLGALAELTPQQRIVVVLRIYEDLSEKQVSRLLKISPSATRSALHRAMTTLRLHMKEIDHE